MSKTIRIAVPAVSVMMVSCVVGVAIAMQELVRALEGVTSSIMAESHSQFFMTAYAALPVSMRRRGWENEKTNA